MDIGSDSWASSRRTESTLIATLFLGWQQLAERFFLFQNHDRMLLVVEENSQSEREFSK